MNAFRRGIYAFIAVITATVFSVYLAGCGQGGPSTGTLTLDVTDSPVSGAVSVVVVFSGVEIQPAEGERINFDFASDREIDLLGLTGDESETILDGVTLTAGQYNWIRLKVKAELGVVDSFIVFEGDLENRISLYVPSGDETGLKLNRPFDVPAGGSADFTIDFDLRKSVHNPEGYEDYVLRPTLRIVDNTEVGKIVGTVDASLLDPDGGNAVYVFEGTDVSPDDIDSNAPEPINTGTVDKVTGEYTVGFLTAGDYTVAFTADADLDDPATDDPVTFELPANVTVTAGETTTHDFTP